jgi:hypothetical protein
MQLLDMVIPRLNLVQLDAYKFDIGEKEVNKFHAILYGTKEGIRFTTVNKGLIISSLQMYTTQGALNSLAMPF